MRNDFIRDAFKAATPTAEQKAGMRSALEARLPQKNNSPGRYRQRQTPPRRFSWIPAAAALLAVVILGGFVLGRLNGETGELSPSQSADPQAVYDGLEDFYASPLYQAIQEWQDYLASHNGEAPEPVPYPYGSFGCVNAQMRQALDALCEKYGLTLQTDDSGGTDSMDYLLEVLGLSSLFKPIPQVESGLVYGAGGWIYPDGGVMMGLSTTMTYDGSPWTDSVIYTLYTLPRQCLFSCLLPLGAVEEYASWEYTTQDGVKLLLARKEDDAFLFTAGEDNVVYVDIGDFRQEDAINGITGEAMEAFAETIDFAALIGLEKAELPHGEEPTENPEYGRYDKLLEKYVTAIREGWDGAQCSEADISVLVRDVKSLDSLGYALLDLDGNGSKELLITDGNVIYDLYTLLDDGPGHLLSGWERNAYFLCEGNVLKNTGSNSAASSFTAFFKLDGIDFRNQETVSFSADIDPENPWFLASNASDALTPITEEQANAVIDSYAVIPIETRPLTEKP